MVAVPARTRSAVAGEACASTASRTARPPRPMRAGVAAAKTQARPSLVGITPAQASGRKIHS